MTEFDDELKDDFIYAWSLPPHPTFERKMMLIQAAIDKATASPPYDYPRSCVFYFTCRIHEAVRVSCLCPNVSLSKLMIYFTRNASSCTVCKCVRRLPSCQLRLRQLLQRRRGGMRSWTPRLVLTWTCRDLFTSCPCVTVTC